MASIYRHLLRATASAAVIVLIAVLCRQVPHVDKLAAGLTLLLTVLGVATQWGFPEAVVAAIAGGLALDYLFIRPFGFWIESLEEVLAVFVFLAVAITTSRLSTQARKHTLEAVQRQHELEKLYAFGQAIVESSNFDGTVDKGLDQIIQTFGIQGAAFHCQSNDRIIRAGKQSEVLTDGRLREVTQSEIPLMDVARRVSIVPLRVGVQLLGSLGFCSSDLSEGSLQALALRFGIAIARAKAFEESARAEAIRKSEELKSLLLDGLAHEFKTPLTTIKVAASSILSRKIEMPASAAELLKVIDEETTDLEQFLNDALQIARIDAGILIVEKGIYDLRNLIESSLLALNAGLEGRPLELRIPDDLPVAHFDFRVMKLVMNELLTNALKYSPPGSPLAISCSLENDAIVVSLTDAGVGVSEGKKNRIFDKYYRDPEKASKAPGSGLGLAIAKSIVEGNGGKIWVKSRTGRGSTFSFSLPVGKETVS